MTTLDPDAGAPDRCDVLLVGAGLVGLALAPALARSGLEVVVADRVPPVVEEPDPASWDTRIYAISPGSADYLRAVGAWQALDPERIAAVESMRIAGDDGALLNFSAYDNGVRALAWIVEERALRNALLLQLHAAGVRVLAPAAIAAIAWAQDAGTVAFADGRRIGARLVIGADGIDSAVRRAAGIAAAPRAYAQVGVVANFAFARAHHGRAHQWFRPDASVLAWLPLPGRRISMVWSAPDALAAELLALDAPALAERVAAAGRMALGPLSALGPAARFPLRFLRPPAVTAHRLALVGDAAHGVHPLAGQGVNLGFGDAEALAAVLRDRGPVRDPGTPLLLGRYARRRHEAVLAMQAVTDGLNRLFTHPSPAAKLLRNLGMTAVERFPAAKRLLAHSALR